MRELLQSSALTRLTASRNVAAHPPAAFSFHYSSVCRVGRLQKVTQERRQLFRYEVAICERSAKPRGERQEPETNSLPAAGKRERRVGGASRPVPAGRGKSGPAARMSGWQGGCAAGSGITLHRCANSSSARHLCPPPPIPSPSLPLRIPSPPPRIPPHRSTAGLTDACKAPEDSTQLHALSEVGPKITTGDSGSSGEGGVQGF